MLHVVLFDFVHCGLQLGVIDGLVHAHGLGRGRRRCRHDDIDRTVTRLKGVLRGGGGGEGRGLVVGLMVGIL